MSKIQIEVEFHEFGEDSNYHIITVEEDDLLDAVSDKTIANYARWTLNMIPEDECDSSLDDYSKYDLVRELKERGFDFLDEATEEQMINYLENYGYTIDPEDSENNLDHIDTPMFEEIQEKFLNSSWERRKDIYNKIINL